MVCAEAQEGGGLIAGTCPANAQTGRGLGLEGLEGRAVVGLLHQILLPQVHGGDVRQDALGHRLSGFVFAGFNLRLGSALSVHLPQHLGDDGFQFFLVHALPPSMSTEPSPALAVRRPFSTKPIFSSQRWKGAMAVRPNSSRRVAVSRKPVVW